MRRSNPLRDIAGLLAMTIVFVGAPRTAAADAAENLARARAFVETLSPELREIASVDISAPDRSNWSYLPGKRPGVALVELEAHQVEAWNAFLTGALGEAGAARARRIRMTEPVTHHGDPARTGPQAFRIRFFGIQGDTPPPAWAWRFEGHHLSLHQTIVGDEVVSATPIFLGSVVLRDQAGEPLGSEDRRAEEILGLLGDGELEQAIDPRRLPGDLRTAMLPGDRWSFEGGVSLEAAGKQARRIADGIVDGLLAMQASDAVDDLRASWSHTASEDITFAWCGHQDRMRPHQWRLVSPTIVVEFSHSGGDVEHGHLVLRTRSGEFSKLAEQAWRNAP